jgi:hypothetical protein
LSVSLSPFELVVLALACWRLAYMLVRESGPGDVFGRLRRWSTFGGVLDCLYCTSVWTAAGVLVLDATPARPLVWVLAVSGAALMLKSWTGAGYEVPQ